MKRRTGGRVDNNQKDIVSALRKVGASVLVCPAVATGFPDLIVGFQGVVHLMEVKNPKTKYGRKGLSATQLHWAAEWKGGPVHLVRSEMEALGVLGIHG